MRILPSFLFTYIFSLPVSQGEVFWFVLKIAVAPILLFLLHARITKYRVLSSLYSRQDEYIQVPPTDYPEKNQKVPTVHLKSLRG